MLKKIKQLEAALASQQRFFMQAHESNENTTKASYKVVMPVDKNGKSFIFYGWKMSGGSVGPWAFSHFQIGPLWKKFGHLWAAVNSEAKNISMTFFKTTWNFENNWITSDKLYGDILFYFIHLFIYLFKRLKPGHHSLQLFGSLLQHLFPVKLQQLFVD